MSEDLYSRPLPMGEFFDRVAHQYDAVHTSHIDQGEAFYVAIGEPITPTNEPIRVLSLGAGTGLDLVAVVERAPNANIDCLDLSPRMLENLQDRFRASTASISTQCASYLDFDYDAASYDLILAAATLHHQTEEEKADLYPRIRKALAGAGMLIIGDFFVGERDAELFREHYDRAQSEGYDVRSGKYHLDIPTTQAREEALLRNAGFKRVETTWQSANYSILVAT